MEWSFSYESSFAGISPRFQITNCVWVYLSEISYTIDPTFLLCEPLFSVHSICFTQDT